MAATSRGPRGLALAAVDEALRYEPITPFTARITITEIEYRGVAFPAGSIVLVSAWHANRDGAEPDEFDITAERGRARMLDVRRRDPLLRRREPRPRRDAGGARVPGRERRSIGLDGEPEFGTPRGIYGLETLPVRLTLA